MKKYIKIFLIIILILTICVLIDTIQAKVFNNRPILKITQEYNEGNVYQRDKGIFVYTYNFIDGEKKTVYKWEKYTPPLNINQEEKNIEGENKMNPKISVIIGQNIYNATLEENKTAQSFLNMLPQEYDMKELNGNEKYIYIDDVFPTNSYNPKHIEKGDIMLYGNNCIVIFYKSFDTSYSYTKIGHIENLPDLGNNDITIRFDINE